MAFPACKVLTANRLQTGEVLYWKAGTWVAGFGQAEIFEDTAQAVAALKEALAFVAANQVVTPYLFEVRQTRDGLSPVKEREIIRSRGPSVRPDTGKQATASHVQI
jgi:sulfite reductase (NADPH) hemoprotein beta-component